MLSSPFFFYTLFYTDTHTLTHTDPLLTTHRMLVSLVSTPPPFITVMHWQLAEGLWTPGFRGWFSPHHLLPPAVAQHVTLILLRLFVRLTDWLLSSGAVILLRPHISRPRLVFMQLAKMPLLSPIHHRPVFSVMSSSAGDNADSEPCSCRLSNYRQPNNRIWSQPCKKVLMFYMTQQNASVQLLFYLNKTLSIRWFSWRLAAQDFSVMYKERKNLAQALKLLVDKSSSSGPSPRLLRPAMTHMLNRQTAWTTRALGVLTLEASCEK